MDGWVEKQLEKAIASRDNVKATLSELVIHTEAWVEAQADLNFWQGKVATYERMVKNLPNKREG